MVIVKQLVYGFFGAALGLSSLTPSSAANDEDTKQLSVSSSETVTPVVELYTSEGCSSCPRADNFITQLGNTVDSSFHAVILSFHVDYWNWLGWADPYSKPEFTERQRMIGEFNNQRSIYTPEIVVAGEESRGGDTIVDKIKLKNTQQATVSIVMNLEATTLNQLDASFEIDNVAETNAQAYIAIYENNIIREIKGGENKGKTLTHDYVVRHWSKPIHVTRGRTSNLVSLEIGKDWDRKNLGLAIIVLNGRNGETLQAVNTTLGTLFST